MKEFHKPSREPVRVFSKGDKVYFIPIISRRRIPAVVLGVKFSLGRYYYTIQTNENEIFDTTKTQLGKR